MRGPVWYKIRGGSGERKRQGFRITDTKQKGCLDVKRMQRGVRRTQGRAPQGGEKKEGRDTIHAGVQRAGRLEKKYSENRPPLSKRGRE